MNLPYQRLLIAAQGYSELGLPELALDELRQVSAEFQHEAMVVETRLSVLMQARRFKDALPFGQELCRVAPEKTAGFIHAAFCLHELGNTREARELLLSGPPGLKAEATYHYNLACYEAVLGNLVQARAHLGVSFAMDKSLQKHASTDPDLKELAALGALGN